MPATNGTVTTLPPAEHVKIVSIEVSAGVLNDKSSSTTSRLMKEPQATKAPADGVWPVTTYHERSSPAGLVSNAASTPKRSNRSMATSIDRPTTSGTAALPSPSQGAGSPTGPESGSITWTSTSCDLADGDVEDVGGSPLRATKANPPTPASSSKQAATVTGDPRRGENQWTASGGSDPTGTWARSMMERRASRI